MCLDSHSRVGPASHRYRNDVQHWHHLLTIDDALPPIFTERTISEIVAWLISWRAYTRHHGRVRLYVPGPRCAPLKAATADRLQYEGTRCVNDPGYVTCIRRRARPCGGPDAALCFAQWRRKAGPAPDQ